MKPSAQKVLDLIDRPEGACMESFVHHRILRYSARIHELRHDHGYVIGEERCERVDHKGHVSYFLVARPGETAQQQLAVMS